MKAEKVTTIEQRNYEGYVWMSDKDKPKVLKMNQDESIKLYEDEGTFVIEAQLCDTENLVSYSVKHIGGEHVIMRYEFEGTDFKRSTVTVENFVGHRMEGYDLQFLRYWEPKEDPACLGMPVLHPTHLVFTGFTNAKTQEK